MPSIPVTAHASDRVVIAVDPHKASWTAVVVGASLAPLAALRVGVDRAGYRQLRRFAAGWPEAIWAIEGAAGLGAPLTEHLHADGIAVVDVPAKLADGCGCCRPGMAVGAMKQTPCRSASPRCPLRRCAASRLTRRSRRCGR